MNKSIITTIIVAMAATGASAHFKGGAHNMRHLKNGINTGYGDMITWIDTNNVKAPERFSKAFDPHKNGLTKSVIETAKSGNKALNPHKNGVAKTTNKILTALHLKDDNVPL